MKRLSEILGNSAGTQSGIDDDIKSGGREGTAIPRGDVSYPQGGLYGRPASATAMEMQLIERAKGAENRSKHLAQKNNQVTRELEYLRGYIAHQDVPCVHCGKDKTEIESCQAGWCQRKEDMIRMLGDVKDGPDVGTQTQIQHLYSIMPNAVMGCLVPGEDE